MENSKVIIGIVTYNRYDLLKKSIESAINQDYPNIEMAILDDASTDETANIKLDYPVIKYIRSTNKSGQVIGRNLLMSTSDAEYYVSLDDDAYFMSNNIISEAVAFMNKNKNIAVLGFDILGPGNKESLLKQTVPYPKAGFIGCGHILRLPSVKQVNYYSPALGWGEEEDLSIKLHNAQFEIYAYPGLFTWHEMTPKARDYDLQWRSQVNNVLSLILRYYPVLLVVPVIVYKMFTLLVFSVKKKIFNVYLKGVSDFFKNSLKIVEHRTPVKFSTITKYHRLLKKIP